MKKTQPAAKILNEAITVLGDSHTLSIIHNLSAKAMRFCELQRAINDLNPATLTARLKKLESEQILIRREDLIDKVSVVYELTSKGRDVLPVINSIANFATKHLN